MIRPLYVAIAATLGALQNCQTAGDKPDWVATHRERLDGLLKDHMPSGSGFDIGTVLDQAQSDAERLVFTTSFHHMDEGGGYSHWTDHVVTVTPSLAQGYRIDVSGPDDDGEADYVADTFHHALSQTVDAQGVRVAA